MPISSYRYAVIPSASNSPVFAGGRFGHGNIPAIDGTLFNNFAFPFPWKLNAGATVILVINRKSGDTVSTISDNRNGSWSTTPFKQAVGTNSILEGYVFSNSLAADPSNGTGLVVTLSYTAGSASLPSSSLEAWSALKTSGATDGGSSSASITTSGTPFTINSGSFSPSTSNDAKGGHLVLSWACADTQGAFGTPSTIASTTGFTLKNASIDGVAANGYPRASSYQVVPTFATFPLNPGFVLTSNNASDKWNVISEAFLVDSTIGGAPDATGMRIGKYYFFSTTQQQSAWTLQVPLNFSNSYPVVTCANGNGTGYTSVTDSQSNTWNFITSDNATPGLDTVGQVWCPSTITAPDQNYKITLHKTSPPVQVSFAAIYDLIGGSFSTGANAWQTTGSTSAGVCPHCPDITPTQSGAIMILAAPDGIGPVLSLSVPNNGVLNSSQFTLNDDTNAENFGNAWAQFPVTAGMVGVSQNVTWTVPTTGGAGAPSAHAVEFKHT